MLYFSYILLNLLELFFGDSMRLKGLLPFIFISAMGFAHAANETSSIRTPAGQIISLGDSFTDMENRMKLSPTSMITHEIIEGKNSALAMDYRYEIENMIYTITIINDQVKKIEWLNTDQDIKDPLKKS